MSKKPTSIRFLGNLLMSAFIVLEMIAAFMLVVILPITVISWIAPVFSTFYGSALFFIIGYIVINAITSTVRGKDMLKEFKEIFTKEHANDDESEIAVEQHEICALKPHFKVVKGKKALSHFSFTGGPVIEKD